MHFWINKSNQQGHYYWPGCRLVRPPPEAVANYLARHQIIRPRGLYPKPMVTPVRRFQSLESVSNNGLRHSRTSPSNRPCRQINSHHVYFNTASNEIIPRVHSIETDQQEQRSPQSLENNELKKYIRKFKIALLIFALLSVCVFFGANYLTTGQLWRLGVENLVIISVALVVLLMMGIVILYLDDRQSLNSTIASQQNLESSNDQLQIEVTTPPLPQRRHAQLSLQQSDVLEMPPPPYHIAIRLSSQNGPDAIQIIDDQSPPPSYEKAIT